MRWPGSASICSNLVRCGKISLLLSWHCQQEVPIGIDITLESEVLQTLYSACINCQVNGRNGSALLLNKYGVRWLSIHLLHSMGNIPGEGDGRNAVLGRRRQAAPHSTSRQIAGQGCGGSEAVNRPGKRTTIGLETTHAEGVVPVGAVTSIARKIPIILPTATGGRNCPPCTT